MFKNCPVCGFETKYFDDQTLIVPWKTSNGIREIEISGLSFEKCMNPECQESFHGPKEFKQEEEKIIEILTNERKEKRLLTAQEIKDIRNSLGLSQSAMDNLLGIAEKSFARWETYKADQSQAMDLLLRAIRKLGIEFIHEILKEKRQDAA